VTTFENVERVAETPPSASGVPRLLHRILRRPVAVGSIVVILTIYTLGILAPWIAPYGFQDADLEHIREGPSWAHPLGTDHIGHDLLSRAIWSAQTTVIISMTVLVSAGLILGTTLGLLSGYKRGRTDFIIMRLGDIFVSVPTILLLLIINASLRDRVEQWVGSLADATGIAWLNEPGVASYFLVVGALSIFGWVGIARLVRSQVLALREMSYVASAQASGASTARILIHHLLPNVSNILIVSLTISLGAVAAAEVTLSFLGIGIQDRPTFGLMISEAVGLSNIREHPHMMLVPAVFIIALVLSFNLLGDQLTDVLSPRRR
jgi:ABC-type dipeptide/oligopeptide/nickel transport system permease subunit